MQKTLVAVTTFLLLISTSCKKTKLPCEESMGNPQASATEIASVQAYLTGAGITTATQHSSGIFYIVNSAGTGATPGQCNNVRVNYTGRLTNGTVFDKSTSTVTFGLYQLIMGWRIGIPLIKAGGSIRLFIPPSLGYGASPVGTIPANSILVFDIDLVGVS